MSEKICKICGKKTNMPFHTCDRSKAPSSLAATAGSAAPLIQFQRTEDYYIECDSFARYIAFEVNPERLKAGLSPINDAVARRCFDIIINQIYRKQPNQ